jgi:hypothetical protein
MNGVKMIGTTEVSFGKGIWAWRYAGIMPKGFPVGSTNGWWVYLFYDARCFQHDSGMEKGLWAWDWFKDEKT